MKNIINSDFYQHPATLRLLDSEIKKLGCRKWIVRYCRLLHMSRSDAFALLRGFRQ